jgi:hypothetical protein
MTSRLADRLYEQVRREPMETAFRVRAPRLPMRAWRRALMDTLKALPVPRWFVLRNVHQSPPLALLQSATTITPCLTDRAGPWGHQLAVCDRRR